VRDHLEEHAMAVFAALLREAGINTFLDVGANVGLYSWSALSVNPCLQLFLFEPDTRNIDLLHRTIRANHLDNVSLWDGAVADQAGEMDFLVDEASGATGSLVDHTANEASLHFAYGLGIRSRVKATTLDTVAERVQGNVLVKIDVEGAERLVLQGGRKFIERHRPLILIECFDAERLGILHHDHYLRTTLDENGNFLLIPEERSTLLAAFGLNGTPITAI